MKLIDGIFKYNETVTIDHGGKLYKRKVHYLDGELYVNIDSQRVTLNDIDTKPVFDKSAYDQKYHKKHTDYMGIAAKKGTKDRWRSAAAERGQSLNAFVIDCVESVISANNPYD